MKAKIQIALDDISFADAEKLVSGVKHFIDIIEVGTPFYMRYGSDAIRKLRKCFPEKLILCDAKIMDAGAYEANIAFEAGADIVTVLGVTDLRTIRDCVDAARKADRKLMVDLICVRNISEMTSAFEAAGADIIGVHTGVDQQAEGRTPLDDLKELSAAVKSAQVSVAGGINADTVDQYLLYSPDIVVVGGGIVKSEDPIEAAEKIYNTIRKK